MARPVRLNRTQVEALNGKIPENAILTRGAQRAMVLLQKTTRSIAPNQSQQQ